MRINSVTSCIMSIVVGLFLGFFPISAFGGVTLVVDGTLLEVKAAELPDCSSVPEGRAMKYTLTNAYGTAISFAQASCQASCAQAGNENCEAFCASDPDQVTIIKKKALSFLFSTVRRYPPASKSEYCAQGRAFCEEQCIGVGALPDKTCVIECNQYELYFKR